MSSLVLKMLEGITLVLLVLHDYELGSILFVCLVKVMIVFLAKDFVCFVLIAEMC